MQDAYKNKTYPDTKMPLSNNEQSNLKTNRDENSKLRKQNRLNNRNQVIRKKLAEGDRFDHLQYKKNNIPWAGTADVHQNVPRIDANITQDSIQEN